MQIFVLLSIGGHFKHQNMVGVIGLRHWLNAKLAADSRIINHMKLLDSSTKDDQALIFLLSSLELRL